MEIDKGDIKDDLQNIQEQVDGMGFVRTKENDIWRRELIADYIVEKLTNISESLNCCVTGCVNIRDESKCYCDEHLID